MSSRSAASVVVSKMGMACSAARVPICSLVAAGDLDWSGAGHGGPGAAGPRAARPVRRPAGVRTRTTRVPPAVSSARVDWVTSRPWSKITTLSTVWATSARMWLETRTVRPSLGQVPKQGAEPVDALGVEAVGGFVEDEDLGVAQQSGGEGEPLAHPEGELPDTAVGGLGQVDEVEDLVDPVGCGAAGKGGDAEVVAGGAPRVGEGRLQGGADHMERLDQVGVAAPVDRGRALRSASTRPRSMRSVVVLPAPLGPRNPTTLPCSTVKLTWSTAVRSPKRLVSRRTRSLPSDRPAISLSSYVVFHEDDGDG